MKSTPVVLAELDGKGLNEQMLQFQFYEGAITSVGVGAVAVWRILPFASIAQVSGGKWRIERDDRAPYFVFRLSKPFLFRRKLSVFAAA